MRTLTKFTLLLTLAMLCILPASADQRFFLSEGYWPQNYSDPSLCPGTFFQNSAYACGLPTVARTTEKSQSGQWGSYFQFAYQGTSGWNYGTSQWISFATNTGTPYGQLPYVEVLPGQRWQHERKVYLNTNEAPSSL